MFNLKMVMGLQCWGQRFPWGSLVWNVGTQLIPGNCGARILEPEGYVVAGGGESWGPVCNS